MLLNVDWNFKAFDCGSVMGFFLCFVGFVRVCLLPVLEFCGPNKKAGITLPNFIH